MTIHDVKDDPILQVPSQESSKYRLKGHEVLDRLLIMLESWNLAHRSRITYHDYPWCQEWPHPPCIQSGTINVLQVWLRGRGAPWHPSFHARAEIWHTSRESHIMTIHDVKNDSILQVSQSGTFNVLQVWLRGRGVLDTLLFMLESWNLAHNSRIPYHDSWWSMMSRMTLSSKTPVRNLQPPPSIDFKDRGFLAHF